MNVLIVEDEFHTANLLKDIIEEDKEFIVVKKVETVMDAVQYLGKYQNNLDLLFFDIQLTDGKSFEIFKHWHLLPFKSSKVDNLILHCEVCYIIYTNN